MTIIYCYGSEIFKAAIAGAERGYNRSTDDYSRYAATIEDCYSELVAGFDDEAQRKLVVASALGMWQRALLPLCLAMLHHHKAGKRCETHARVYMHTNPGRAFDIPLKDWQRLCAMSTKRFNKPPK